MGGFTIAYGDGGALDRPQRDDNQVNCAPVVNLASLAVPYKPT